MRGGRATRVNQTEAGQALPPFPPTAAGGPGAGGTVPGGNAFQIFHVEHMYPARRLHQRPLGVRRQELAGQAVGAADEVVHLRRGDAPPAGPQGHGVERSAEEQVGVEEGHKLRVRWRVTGPVHDARRLVVRTTHVPRSGVVLVVGVHVRRPHAKGGRLPVGRELGLVAGEEPRDAGVGAESRTPETLKHARRHPVEGGRALRGEEHVQGCGR